MRRRWLRGLGIPGKPQNLRLNQVTLAAPDMAASVVFYRNLGLNLIVDSAPRYVRFEFPPNEHGEPTTLSLHAIDPGWAPAEWPLIYFEVDDLDTYLADHKLKPLTPPKTQTYLWREADILDPAGNKIRLYQAGENRRFPPWRVD
ncbi:MAG: VOC family protein [Robiginitomaculum sp.]|nr:VOC family protein [Robiginitomaculum sp.]